MFGEYALYCDDKVVALVCDDQLFVKPTSGGLAFIGDVTEAPPYPGSKTFFRIDEEKWEDREWMRELIAITTAEVPVMKPKKRLDNSLKKNKSNRP
jgi:TfoX/Sxy family transcriptional regulator of competence genes